jgi:hypothetical protein
MNRIVRFAALAAACIAVLAQPLAAATVVAGAKQENQLYAMTVSATANYTNSTTTPSDITGATVTVPATRLGYTTQYYRVCFYADAGKATATNGTIGLTVNGSAVTAAARSISSGAVRGALNSCHVAARPTASAFIVKLTGVSGDTNAFTVYNALMTVEAFYITGNT